VSPNPASDAVNFTCNNATNAVITINVIDGLGRTVTKTTMTGNTTQLNTSTLASGFYYYKALDENNNLIGDGKFIVSHK
jgi:hypothetical protein